MYPLVTELAAAGIPVTVTCRVLKLARPQPYYRWRNNPITDSKVVQAYRVRITATSASTQPRSCPGLKLRRAITLDN